MPGIAHEAGVWQLKLASHLGKNISRALVAGGCALEYCTSLPWTIYNPFMFGNNGPRMDLVSAAKADCVTNLSLAGFMVGGAGSSTLAEFLRPLTALTSLDLRCNDLLLG
jgi:hypothetical protein